MRKRITLEEFFWQRVKKSDGAGYGRADLRRQDMATFFWGVAVNALGLTAPHGKFITDQSQKDCSFAITATRRLV